MKNIFRLKKIKNREAGFSVVEVLIACLIMSMITLALMSAATRGIILSTEALKKVQASNLMEEGVEAMKSIRDNNWDTISDLNLETDYYLTFDINTNTWSLGVDPVSPIDGFFTRKVLFSPVYRDSNDDISSSGTLDNGIKRVTVTVSWPSSENINSKNITFYLANIFN